MSDDPLAPKLAMLERAASLGIDQLRHELYRRSGPLTRQQLGRTRIRALWRIALMVEAQRKR